METPLPQLAALILAGGQSSRMGRDKAWVGFKGKPLINTAVDTVHDAGISEVFISGRLDRDYSALHCPVLYDLRPGLGPMSGLERGLSACSTPLLLVLAVDLPRITIEFLRILWRQCDAQTGVVPELNGSIEPLAAIYPKDCHSLAVGALSSQRRAVRDFAEACLQKKFARKFIVDPRENGLFSNANTPADLSP